MGESVSPGTVAPKRVAEPLLATVVRAAVHAITAGVFAWPLAVPSGVVAATVGAALGSIAGRTVARTRARLPVAVAVAALLLLVAFALGHVAVATDLLAPGLGPAAALRVGDAIELGLGAFAIVAGLRSISARHPSAAVIEVALVALAFAGLVVAHRHGAINRPFEIADPILSQGGDPTSALLGIGAAAAGVLMLLLLSERSLLRSGLHIAAIALILLLVLGGTAAVGLPAPPPTGGGLGLRSDREGDGEGSRGGQGSGRRDNEELEFRDNYDSQANRVPLGVVLFHDDYSPPTGVYYFRQGAFSEYNGRRLVRASRGDVDRDIAPSFPTDTVTVPGAPAAGMYRAPLETTVALLADHNRPFALESPKELRPARNPNPSRFRRVYRALSASLTMDYAALLGAQAGDPAWSPEQWALYTAGPEDARYGEAAARMIDEGLPAELQDDPLARALAITSWLGEHGIYSIRSSHSGAADPTADFLFGDLTGYCVHFAHASAYLMRSVGLPARVATGYAVDEASRHGGSALLVTGQDSHAWPEVYLADVGWVVVDVSPQTVLGAMPAPPDPDLQRLLAEMLRGEEPLPLEGRPVPAIGAMAGGVLLEAGRVAGAAFLVALLLALLGKLWRRTAPLVARKASLPRVAYRAELDRLSELRLRRRWGESREAFARRVADRVPSFVTLTETHVGAAFGSRSEHSNVRNEARAVRRDLGRTFPRWRRAVASIDPISWMLSR